MFKGSMSEVENKNFVVGILASLNLAAVDVGKCFGIDFVVGKELVLTSIHS